MSIESINFRYQLERTRTAAMAVKGSLPLESPHYNAVLVKELTDLILSLNDTLTNKNPLQKKRPAQCVCLRSNLRNGTAAPSCQSCLGYGYVSEVDAVYQEATRRVHNLSVLGIGWDQLGGLPPSPQTRDLAYVVVDILNPSELQITPCPDGSVEIYRKTGAYIQQVNVLAYKE